MKKIAFLAAPALLLLGACAGEDHPALGQGEGAIALHLTADGNVTDAVPVTRASQATVVPEASQLALSLVKNDGTYSQSWNSIDEFPADKPFATGDYVMQASWGSLSDEGFEKPYYLGTADVLVEEGNTTEVNLTATLANTMVSIAYTEAFRQYFSQFSSQLHAEGGSFIAFTSDEERPAYLRPGNVTLTLSITKHNGVSANIQPAEFEALPRHHYHITLDVNGGDTGDGELAVIFDDSVVAEDVTVDLSDEVLAAPEPTVKVAGFTPGETYEALEYSAPASPLTMTVTAPGGLRSATLTTQSDALLAKGFPAEIDLMAATPAQQALLKQCGLDTKGLWRNPDKIAVVDLTGLFNTIGGEGTHSFTLVAKDKLGKVNLPVTLTASTQAVGITLKNAPAVGVNAEQATVNITTDTPDINNVGVEIYSFGTWSEARILSAAPAASARHKAPGVSKDYTLRFAIPAEATDLPVRLTFKGQPKTTGTIAKRGAVLKLEGDNYVFATHATFKVVHNPNVPLTSLHFFAAGADGQYASTTNVSIDAATDRVTIKGLTPSTAYKVKADEGTSAADALAPASFTTEKSLQLPNAGMEDWCITNSASNWELRFPGTSEAESVWGTNNPMTTSQGANYAYVRISGTKPVTGRNGQAACISTQGWGSGNSAVGTMSGACKYLDPGLLHLGASRTTRPAGYSEISGPLNTDDLKCGYNFASRPSSLKFWYKYEAKNSADQGVAIATVYDKDGSQIASGTLTLGSQKDWVEQTIPLTYAPGAAKAARIYVCFMSTNQSTALTKNKNWLTPPSFGNLSRGEWYGSRLYIDDIQLTY